MKRAAWRLSGRRLLAMLLLCAGCLLGNRPAAAQRFSMQMFGPAQGLTNVAVACIVQSRDGYLFVCTERSLFAHNGRRFRRLGPANGLPDGGESKSVAIDSQQYVFVTFSSAVYVSTTPLGHDRPPEQLRFRRIPMAGNDGTFNSNREIVPWQGGAVLFSDRTLLFADPGTGLATPLSQRPGFASIEPFQNHVVSLSSGGGRLWFSLDDGRICSLTRKSPAQNSLTCLGIGEGLPAHRWFGLLVARDGSLWARSLTTVIHLPVGARRIESFPVPGIPTRYAGIGHDDRLTLLEAPDGGIVTQGDDSITVLHGTTWSKLDSNSGIPAVTISAMTFDREGGLWLGLRGLGVARSIGYGRWENFDRRDGLSDNVVWQIAPGAQRAAEKGVWVATEKGVDLVGGTPLRRDVFQIYGDATYALSLDAGGNLWRATGGRGLYRTDAKSGIVSFVDMPGVNIIAHGQQGRLWVATQDGLFTIDSDAPTVVPRRITDLTGSVQAVAPLPDGSAWLLVPHHLVHCSATGVLRRIETHWDEPDFDPRELVPARDGSLWVGGTTGHLLRLAIHGDQGTVTERVGQPDIISSTVVSLFTDHRGWLWVATDQGLSVFDGQRWTSADAGSGLVWNDMNEGAIAEGLDGSMWFGTSGGLSHLLVPKSLFERPPLDLIILDATVGPRHLMDSSVIPMTHDPLSIRFGTLNFDDRSSIRYRYRLDGVDEGWVETSAEEVRYPFLPSGRHIFQLQAFNPVTGQVSETAALPFSMQFPWWRTWWFEMSAVIAVALAGYLVVRLRTRFLLFRQKQLQALVDLRTEEIRAAQAALLLQATRDGLTGLPNRSEIQRRLQERLQAAAGRPVFVGLLDIDHFKSINDRFGHLAGDEVLQEVGRRLTDVLAPEEAAGRYGGEEFLILLGGAGPATLTRWSAIKDALTARPFTLDGIVLPVTCSLGISRGRAGESWQTVIRRADKALYRAKADGRDRVVDADLLGSAA